MKHNFVKNIHLLFNSREGKKNLWRNTDIAIKLIFVGCLLGSIRGAAQCSAPLISSVSPLFGYAGSAVTITGSGFNSTASNNVVYFGAAKATVSSASGTSLSVTVPNGVTYSPVTVLNSSCSLTGYSIKPFLETYNNAGLVSNTVNFASRVDFTTTSFPDNIAYADIDGDGKVDILTNDEVSGNISLFRNTSTSGSVSFGTRITVASITDVHIVQTGDVDGDGKLDVIAEDYYGNVYICRNTSTSGSVSFASTVTLPYAFPTASFCLCDIDGDGKTDIVTGTYQDLAFAINTSTVGSISFTTTADSTVPSWINWIAAGDVDGDGRADIILGTNSTTNGVSVYRNTSTAGSPSLAARQDLSSVSDVSFVTLADIDGDGKKDILTANGGSTMSVFKNTSTSGSITTGTRSDFTFGANPTTLAIGDFDGNGKADIAASAEGANIVTVFLNTSSTGSFTFNQVNFATLSQPAGVATADFDADGKTDIAVTEQGANKFSVFLNAPLHPITGTTTLCSGATTTLSETTTGGTWASSNPAVGSVSSSGVVTGVSAGTATISYIGTAGSSFAANITTVNVTVNAATVAAITGNTTLSTAITTSLADATAGGTWSSANTAVATVGSTGIVSGVSAGSAVISYTLSSVCSGTPTVTTNVTVKTPANGLKFDGVNDYVDVDTILTGGHSYTKEAWVYLNSYGPHNIFSSYDYPLWVNGTVLMMSNSYAHSGYVYIYDTDSFPLSQWVHVAATYDSATHTARLFKNGVVVASSTTFPTYTSDKLLIGSWVGGYTWDGVIDEVRLWDTALSQATIKANMNCDVPQQSHLVAYYRFDQGTAGGSNSGLTCVYDYSGNSHSGTTKNFALTGTTSNYVTGAIGSCNTATPATPGAFSGNTPLCSGTSITLTNAVTGGKWSTSSSLVSVNSTSGVVTGITSGTAIVNYTINCSTASIVVTVLATPSVAAISGNTTLSTTITTTLTDATAGGTWSSGATGIATVGTSGVVTGVAAGTALISYTVGSGCNNVTVTTNVTVMTPANGLSFDGVDDYVDMGSILTNGHSYTKEAWVYCNGTYSNNILSSTDNPFWVAGGFLHLANSYAHSGTTTLVDPTLFPTGQWVHVAVTYDSATHTAQMLRNGVVVASSTSFATYTTSNMQIGAWQSGNIWDGMIDEVRIWDTALSAATVQANMNCNVSQQSHLVAYYRLDQGTAGGTNSGVTCVYDYSGNGNGGSLHNFALTGSTSNYVTGAVGNCNTATPATPGAFSGNTPFCPGGTITLSNALTGGTWSTTSSNITVNSTSGVVTGVSAGTATVNYTVNCSTASVTVTVMAFPVVAAISGNTTLSTAITTTLADATPGGVWASGATGIATVGTSGVVTGVAAGTARISYTVTSGCTTTVTTNVTVQTPANCFNFDGVDDYVHVANGYPAAMSDFTYEMWVKPTSLSGFKSMLNTDGFSAGAVHFQFSGSALEFSVSGASPTDQYSSYAFSAGQWYHLAAVYSSGSRYVKLYVNGNLTDSLAYTTAPAIPGGMPYSIGGWYNGGISRAFSGNIDEVRVWNVARTTTQIQANMNCNDPQSSSLVAYYRFDQGTAGGSNTGLTCVYDYSGNGNSGTLNNAALTGSTSNYETGAVGNCNTAIPLAPGTISGNTPVCAGASITLSNAIAGGTWSTTGSSATVGSTSGLVTGVTAGAALVNYTLNCSVASTTVTVNALPSVSPISGNTTLSTSITTALTDATPGGVWASGATGVATVGTSGVVTGIATGTAPVSYTVTSLGCSTTVTTNVTVNAPANCFNFDGVDDYVHVANGYPAAMSDFTYEMWVKPTLFSSFKSMLNTDGFSAGAVHFQFSGSALEFSVSGASPTDQYSSYAFSAGQWYHLAAVYSSGSRYVKLYVNGNLTDSLVYTTAPAIPGGMPYSIGGWYNSGISRAFSGSIDEVRVWNVARATTQIQANMNCNDPQSSSLVAYYRFDQGTAGGTNSGLTCVYDYSGNGNSGTLNNASLTGSSSNYISGGVGSCNSITLPVPGTISGNAPVCAGASITLSNSVAGGSWSTAGSNFTVNSSTGLVTAIAAGTAAANYTLNCSTSSVAVTVNAVPVVGPITGTTISSIAATTTLSDTTTGGVWVSTNPAVAVVSATGVVTGISAGSSIISYAVSGPCPVAASVNVTVPVNTVPVFTGGSPQSLSICTTGYPLNTLLEVNDGDMGQTETYSIISGPSHGVITTGGAAISAGGAVSPTGWRYVPSGGYSGTDAFTIGVSDGAGGTAITTINVNVSTAMPALISMTGGGGYCSGGTGINIGLAGSAVGINYQLYLGGVPVGAPVPGVGMSFNFGLQTAAGTYTATAINATTGCTSVMPGSVTVIVEPLPTAYPLTGGGSFCSGSAGVPVGVGNSDIGYRYQLYRDGLPLVGTTISGTGAAISFGLQTTRGMYTVVATNNVTGCANTMTGTDTVMIKASPSVYSVTGGGTYCSGGTGVAVGLSNSQAGTSYQLFRGTSPVSTLVSSASSAISFGLQTVAGTYTVIATNSATRCTSNMSGSAGVAVTAVPTAYTVTGGGDYCAGGSGVVIGLSGSQAAMSYQLYYAGVPEGSPVAGSGGALSFGLHTGAGTYTVVGTSACSTTMSGSATIRINTAPNVYTVTGGGSSCSGTSGITVGLGGSDTGVNYQLFRGSTATGTPVAGTGGAITFGPQSISGTYTVVATNASTGCTSNMSGSAAVAIGTLPAAASVTGGGGYCSGGTGVHVRLSGSAVGVSYQLYLGSSPVGSSLAGTGTALDFGLQTTAGTYTATAINSSGCTNNMTGSATVTILAVPASYTVTGGGDYCSGGTGVHIGLSGSATGVTYKLCNGGISVASLSGTGSALDYGLFTTTGVYTVVGINGSGCSTTMSGSTTVSMNPTPAISGSAYTVAPGATISLSGSISGGTWASAYPAYATVGSSSGVVTGIALGSTLISYTLPTGCYDVQSIAVTASGHRSASGAEATPTAISIIIYPNPNHGSFVIKGAVPATSEKEDVVIVITDVLGKTIYNNTVTAQNGEINEEVQLRNTANGMYLLTVHSAAGDKVFHVVVEQ